MAENALGNEDVDTAGNLVSFLDEHGLVVAAALWVCQPDTDRWRFVLSFREKRENVPSLYRDIAHLIDRHGGDKRLLALSRVDIVDPEHLVVSALKRAIRADGNCRIRFTNSTVNGAYLKDVLILRLAG